MIAFSLDDGSILAQYDSGQSDEPFASRWAENRIPDRRLPAVRLRAFLLLASLSMTEAGDALYVQSRSSLLWRIIVSGTLDAGNFSLNGSWSCFYTSAGSVMTHTVELPISLRKGCFPRGVSKCLVVQVPSASTTIRALTRLWAVGGSPSPPSSSH